MIFLKSREEIEIMRRSNQIVAEVLNELKQHIVPRVTTLELDSLAERMTLEKGAKPAFKGYRVGSQVFPLSLCVSVNEELVHGIPSERPLAEGDIVGIDFGVVYQGYYGDAAITVGVGSVSEEARRLMRVTEDSLYGAIKRVRAGVRLGEVSHAIQTFVEGAGFSVVREFVGHGIGRRLHEEPPVPNFGSPDRGVKLREGMVLAIEPMVNAGEPGVTIKEDGWTVVTRDGSLAAHFEHSVAVTEDGPEILSGL
jgi:methionyl aminopeptidase